MNVLKTVLKKEFPIEITTKHIKAIMDMRYLWEHRNKHFHALNTPMLGVDKIQFIDTDQRNYFDIFGVDREHFKQYYHTSEAVYYVKFDAEDDEVGKKQLAKVASDPFNGFVLYICHLIANSSLSETVKKEGIGDSLLLMHYKFFTSIVNYNFPVGADLSIMKYTIEHLNSMYTIKKDETSTWFLLLREQAYNVYTPGGTHYNDIRRFDDDQRIVYILTNAQTKVSKFLRNIINEYYYNHESDNRIIATSSVTEIDGKKLIQSINTSYQNIIMNIVGDAINLNRFIDNNLIVLTVKLNQRLKFPAVKTMFMTFSTIAAIQYKAGKSELVEKTPDGKTLYIGYKSLLSAIIQKSFRLCVVDGVDIKSEGDILIKVKNAFTSSKIDNQDVEDIKNSIGKFIEDNKVTSNEATIPALRIAFVIYIMLLSFKYI